MEGLCRSMSSCAGSATSGLRRWCAREATGLSAQIAAPLCWTSKSQCLRPHAQASAGRRATPAVAGRSVARRPRAPAVVIAAEIEEEVRIMGQGGGYGGGRGPGRGRQGGPKAAGPGGYCICPSCGHRQPHQAGQPCTSVQCPKCGIRMVRE